MGRVAGTGLRLFLTFLYAIEFCCAAIGLAIYSYFLAKLSYHHLPIDQKWRAVEGITGAAVLYTIFAVILTCFLGGVPFFAVLAVLLNLCFCGAFVAVAVLTRSGDHSCSGDITTPLGTGFANTQQAGTNQGTACRLNSAVFAVSIAAAVLFLISLLLQIFLMRNHRKEQKYGPSPSNNYTSGSGNRKFWQRKQAPVKDAYANDTELATAGAGNGFAAGHVGNKTSHETGYTGTTEAADHYGSKYEVAQGGTGVVHPGPGPTALGNPYGYSNTPATGTAVNY